MRTLTACFALLTSLLLAVGGAGSFKECAEAGPAAAACKCAACGPTCCCVEGDTPASPQPPAVPTRTLAPDDWQGLVWLILRSFERPLVTAPPVAFRSSRPASPLMLPLYQRDCAFLL